GDKNRDKDEDKNGDKNRDKDEDKNGDKNRDKDEDKNGDKNRDKDEDKNGDKNRDKDEDKNGDKNRDKDEDKNGDKNRDKDEDKNGDKNRDKDENKNGDKNRDKNEEKNKDNDKDKDKERINFYNYEYIHYIQNVTHIIDLNNFNNFKFHLDLLTILLNNISENVLIEQSNYFINFLNLLTNEDIKPLIKSEFLIFINVIYTCNFFPSFFSQLSEYMIKNILLRLCVWKTGLSEAHIRKGALYCIRTIFIKGLYNSNIFHNNILIEKLLSILQTSIDDTWHHQNRQLCILIYEQIAKKITNNVILINLLNNLIKLLDDTQEKIRKCTANVLLSLFQNTALVLPDNLCEQFFPILLLHMDDENFNFSRIMYQILIITKHINPCIFKKHAERSKVKTTHAIKFMEELMK
ncbi:conserved protein, unknown function, partial [Hepatocystis sp. ex Piliocolobus tephrosceles]